MISRDLKFQCHKYSCWHFQEQSMDNESKCDERQRDRENGQWYQDFSYTWIHALTFSKNHTNSHTQTHKKNVCVCSRAPCVLVLLLKGRAAAEHVSLWAGYLEHTSACRFGKHQSKCLCSAVGSPANVCSRWGSCKSAGVFGKSCALDRKRTRTLWVISWKVKPLLSPCANFSIWSAEVSIEGPVSLGTYSNRPAATPKLASNSSFSVSWLSSGLNCTPRNIYTDTSYNASSPAVLMSPPLISSSV